MAARARLGQTLPHRLQRVWQSDTPPVAVESSPIDPDTPATTPRPSPSSPPPPSNPPPSTNPNKGCPECLAKHDSKGRNRVEL